jgi:hypothetical protein
MIPTTTSFEGPFDVAPWPETLTARVVTPGPRPRVHGYDSEDDLARNASLAETFLLLLQGELPTRTRARAFEIVAAFLAPVAVNEAPSHAAVLARLCQGTSSAILGTAAIALAEEARFTVARLAPVWEWLEAPTGDVPASIRATNDDDRASVARLRTLLGRAGLGVSALEYDVERPAALVAAMIACGLPRPHHVEAAWVLVRLPAAYAEAMAEKPGNLREYPANLPPFHYYEESGR